MQDMVEEMLGKVKVPEQPSTEGIQVVFQTGHASQITSVAMSPDGRYMLSGGMDETARLWEIASGQEVHEFTGISLYGLVSVESTDGETESFLRQVVAYRPTAHPLRLHQQVEVVGFVVFSGAALGLSRPHRCLGVDHSLTGTVRSEDTLEVARDQGRLSNLG